MAFKVKQVIVMVFYLAEDVNLLDRYVFCARKGPRYRRTTNVIWVELVREGSATAETRTRIKTNMDNLLKKAEIYIIHQKGVYP